MGNSQADKRKAAQQKVKSLPKLEVAKQDVKLLSVEIPKTGPDAYEYNDNDRTHLIGSGGFGFVFRAVRNYDKQTFAIKVSMKK